MMDLWETVLELMDNVATLVTKPFLLVKLSCIFGLRSLCIIVITLVELLRAAVNFHVNMLWRHVIWTSTLICLPVRILTALQRERQLKMQLQDLQIDLEELVWNKKEVDGRLQIAIKKCKMMEGMLAELSDEHDEAIVRIEQLERELQDIKQENLRLKEIEGKGRWSLQTKDYTGKGNGVNNDAADKYNTTYGIKPRNPSFNGSNSSRLDNLMHKSSWEDEIKTKAQTLYAMKTGSEVSEHGQVAIPDIVSRSLEISEVLIHRREVALQQSLFSAVMSLVVGMIVWEAEDPCMPLIVALFTVVGMSLRSVILFFSTIKNKPASDSVALLSFNCFMLGTLTYPTLPIIARIFCPTAVHFLESTVGWMGFSS